MPLALSLLALSACAVVAAPLSENPRVTRLSTPEVTVAPDRPDWTYKVGEPATFTIRVTDNGLSVPNAEISYRIGPETLEGDEQTAILEHGEMELRAEPLETPGFLRCIASVELGDRTYTGMATVAFSPEDIEPTQRDPDDFDAFWQENLERLEAIPLEFTKTLLPDRCSPNANVYKVQYQSWGPEGWGSEGRSRFYGILTEPAKPGKYPAVLQSPGAGVRPRAGNMELAENGFIALEIGINSIPVDLEEDLYRDLRFAALRQYWSYNLDDRDEYYYRRVYLGCVKALDVLTQHPAWDGRTLIAYGGSQGGLLSIVTAALDERVTHVVAFYPAYCDVTGTLHDRAGGWPQMFKRANHRTEAKIATTAYYDGVNFAKRLKAPGLYGWGYNDTVCPPTSLYSAYNSISAPKELALQLDMGHSSSAELRAYALRHMLRISGLARERGPATPPERVNLR